MLRGLPAEAGRLGGGAAHVAGDGARAPVVVEALGAPPPVLFPGQLLRWPPRHSKPRRHRGRMFAVAVPDPRSSPVVQRVLARHTGASPPGLGLSQRRAPHAQPPRLRGKPLNIWVLVDPLSSAEAGARGCVLVVGGRGQGTLTRGELPRRDAVTVSNKCSRREI